MSDKKVYQIAVWEDTTQGSHPIGQAVWAKKTLQPMTSPEVVDWAEFNGYIFVTELATPQSFTIPQLDHARISFEVHRVDSAPLSEDDLKAFSAIRKPDTSIRAAFRRVV